MFAREVHRAERQKLRLRKVRNHVATAASLELRRVQKGYRTAMRVKVSHHYRAKFESLSILIYVRAQH